jgi:multimeric flavodoxin WrbA
MKQALLPVAGAESALFQCISAYKEVCFDCSTFCITLDDVKNPFYPMLVRRAGVVFGCR